MATVSVNVDPVTRRLNAPSRSVVVVTGGVVDAETVALGSFAPALS